MLFQIDADYFYVVVPGVGTLAPSGEDRSVTEEPPAHSPVASSEYTEAASPQFEASLRASKPRAGSRQPGYQAQQLCSAFLADHEATIGALAARMGVEPKRAMNYLVECGASGVPIDYKRLAAQLYIGPAGSVNSLGPYERAR